MALLIATLVATSAAQSIEAGKLQVAYSFAGQPDGSLPLAAPIQDKLRNLYSTTAEGGTMDWGTVYKIDSQGKETVLHSFVAGKDGVTPTAGVTMDAEGNLYGTTYWGGNGDCFDGNGCGLVYKLSPGKRGWKETILYAFTGASDGAYPGNGALVFDTAGNLYGTTLYGGSESWPNGNGTVFKLTPTSRGWKEHVLYAFGTLSKTDGATPFGGLILDAERNIYGTTYYGGKSNAGIVFEVNPKGSETILHNFKGGTTDGADPGTMLVRDGAGNLFGATPFGGDLNCSYPIGCGTVFKIDVSGTESLLHIFTGYPFDGYGGGPLLQDKSGYLYGAAGGGNSSNCRDSNNEPMGCGVIFGLSTNGKETILYNFSYDGENPVGLKQYAGSFYGVTALGGTSGNGLVFKFTR
jgi:uncharacterized repeat protein (TIGR03803 family)